MPAVVVLEGRVTVIARQAGGEGLLTRRLGLCAGCLCDGCMQSEQRPQRCTGVALSVASGLLESAFPRQVGQGKGASSS